MRYMPITFHINTQQRNTTWNEILTLVFINLQARNTVRLDNGLVFEWEASSVVECFIGTRGGLSGTRLVREDSQVDGVTIVSTSHTDEVLPVHVDSSVVVVVVVVIVTISVLVVIVVVVSSFQLYNKHDKGHQTLDRTRDKQLE